MSIGEWDYFPLNALQQPYNEEKTLTRTLQLGRKAFFKKKATDMKNHIERLGPVDNSYTDYKSD